MGLEDLVATYLASFQRNPYFASSSFGREVEGSNHFDPSCFGLAFTFTARILRIDSLSRPPLADQTCFKCYCYLESKIVVIFVIG